MSILVGPERVTTICACGTQGLRSQCDNLEARNPSSLGYSTVRAIGLNGGKSFQSLLAGAGSVNSKNAMLSTESGILLASVPSRRRSLNLCKVVRYNELHFEAPIGFRYCLFLCFLCNGALESETCCPR